MTWLSSYLQQWITSHMIREDPEVQAIMAEKMANVVDGSDIPSISQNIFFFMTLI